MAIKTCTKEALDSMMQEIEILANCQRHPNVVAFYGCSTHDPPCMVYLYIPLKLLSIEVMQLFNGGSLKSLLDKDPDLSFTTRLSILKQAAAGVNHLHMQEQPIIHRDIVNLLFFFMLLKTCIF